LILALKLRRTRGTSKLGGADPACCGHHCRPDNWCCTGWTEGHAHDSGRFDDRWRPDPPSAERAAFLDGLRGLAYITGQNIIIEYRIEYRSAAWNRELLSRLAAQLVELGVDLILATGPQATRAARGATQKIPIVMIACGALDTGLVSSLARHGEPARTEPAWALAHEGDRRIVIREDVLDRLLPRYGARRPRSWTWRPETFRPPGTPDSDCQPPLSNDFGSFSELSVASDEGVP
jgi:hypothetical protein